MKDHFGACVFTFSKELALCSAVLLGVLTGLRLLIQRGFQNVVIDLDSACSTYV